jgi:hypothetical protein
MAVIAAEGYATEAVRTLFRNADKSRNYQLFVFHDADPDGYNIARTLREETSRMPGYQVEVIDLGLKLEDALAMGLQTEKFTRSKALPEGLVLTETERAYFEGEQVRRKKWLCRRVEMNAMTAPGLVDYIERKLQEAGAWGKVIPPDEALLALTEEIYRQEMNRYVEQLLRQLLSLDTLQQEMAEEFQDQVALSGARSWIEEAFVRDPCLSWRGALQGEIATRLAAGSALDFIQ